jgi:hypothetical protein
MDKGDRHVVLDCFDVHRLWEQYHERIVGIVQVTCV